MSARGTDAAGAQSTIRAKRVTRLRLADGLLLGLDADLDLVPIPRSIVIRFKFPQHIPGENRRTFEAGQTHVPVRRIEAVVFVAVVGMENESGSTSLVILVTKFPAITVQAEGDLGEGLEKKEQPHLSTFFMTGKGKKVEKRFILNDDDVPEFSAGLVLPARLGLLFHSG